MKVYMYVVVVVIKGKNSERCHIDLNSFTCITILFGY